MSDHLPVVRALCTALAFAIPLFATGAQAAEPGSAPFQLALWSPIQIVDSERSIRGFRYSLLWGVNQDVTGVDFSTFASKANGSVRGFQWALGLNQVGGDVVGVQAALGVNEVDGDFRGFQDGILNITRGGFSGLQLGFGNDTRGHMRGVQLGFVLVSLAGKITGVQFSPLVNKTTQGKGLQVALINVAEDLKGLQLGLLNFNKNGILPFFPGVNFGL